MKNLCFGSLAISIALFASAATTTTLEPTNLATRYWINTGTYYIQFSGGTPKPALKCKGISTAPCTIESDDPNIPPSFPISDLPLYNHAEVPGSIYAAYEP